MYRSKCVQSILDDVTTSTPPETEVMMKFWRIIFMSSSDSSPGVGERRNEDQSNLCEPITKEKVRGALPTKKTAPGLDGIADRDIRRMLLELLTVLFNIFLILGKIPVDLIRYYTILIPKKEEAALPGDFRPITNSSLLTRTFQKILAKHLMMGVKIDEKQKVFRSVDGCAENTLVLDQILRHQR